MGSVSAKWSRKMDWDAPRTESDVQDHQDATTASWILYCGILYSTHTAPPLEKVISDSNVTNNTSTELHTLRWMQLRFAETNCPTKPQGHRSRIWFWDTLRCTVCKCSLGLLKHVVPSKIEIQEESFVGGRDNLGFYVKFGPWWTLQFSMQNWFCQKGGTKLRNKRCEKLMNSGRKTGRHLQSRNSLRKQTCWQCRNHCPLNQTSLQIRPNDVNIKYMTINSHWIPCCTWCT